MWFPRVLVLSIKKCMEFLVVIFFGGGGGLGDGRILFQIRSARLIPAIVIASLICKGG